MKVVENLLARRLDEVRPTARAKILLNPVEEPSLRLVPPQPPARKRTTPKLLVAPAVTRRFNITGKFLFFMLAVLAPTAIGGVYYSFFASPQYVSEFRFAVRPNSGSATNTSSSDAALTMSNSYIVSDYAGSRDAVLALESSVNLRKIYEGSNADIFSRLKAGASTEELVKYWNSRIHTSYDMTTGINIIEVSAFSPASAQAIALGLKLLCEKLVNKISDDARKSQMQFARAELDRAEFRLKDVRSKETAMRLDQRTIDARKEADGGIQLSLKIRSDLSVLQAQYDSLKTYMSPQSPRLTLLRNQILASQDQLTNLQSQVGDKDNQTELKGNVNAEAITRYDQLQTDLDIASKLYESSLTNYEAARAQSANNQIYLATYVQPGIPENAAYPRAFFDTILIFLSAAGIWIVLTLIYYSIRDHA